MTRFNLPKPHRDLYRSVWLLSTRESKKMLVFSFTPLKQPRAEAIQTQWLEITPPT